MMRTSTQRGFTLVEMIVSIGLFSIVMLVSVGAYLIIVSSDRRARTTNDLSTSLSFAIESMGRTIRTGTNYQCGGSGGTNCWPTGQSILTLKDDKNQDVTYLLKADGTIGACTSLPCTSSNATSITDPRIAVSSLTFFVQGVGTSDQTQPRVTFLVKGSIIPDARSTTTPITFSIQNTAAQRALDL